MVSLKVNRRPVLVKSTPLLLTSSDTLPGLLEGAVHTTRLADSRMLRATDLTPKRQVRSLVSAKLLPTKVTLDPPAVDANDGDTLSTTGSL